MDVLISLVIFLIIVGALLYIVRLLPIDGTIKQIVYVVIVVVMAVYLLSALLGVAPRLPVLR